MIFNAPKPLFGRKTAAETFPAPITGKAKARRTAQLAEAGDVLTVLPGDGETLHALMTGRYDLMHLVVVLVGKIGRCDEMRIATLSYNRKNLVEMLAMLDGGAVGKLVFLASSFFRDHNKDIWAETLDEFRQRGQRAAAARNHCKVVTLKCNDGRRFSLFGSANLRSNGNRERLTLTCDPIIHDWDSAWIDQLVGQHEGEAT